MAPSAALARAGTLTARIGGPALVVTYLSLLVILPVAALVTNAFSGGWSTFWAAVSSPESVSALELTLALSAIVAVVNSIAGVAIAWVLVRDDFRGKALVSAVIDLPFALPTIVAGLTLLALYGPDSPFHINLAGTRLGVAAALLFVTLPFCVRSVQPVLAELDAEIEEAAASLGATHRQVLLRVVLPSILPSALAGAGLAFARAVGEFGSIVLISGNLPFKTQVASSWIYDLFQNDELPQASAVSVVLIVIALVVLVAIGWARRRFEITRADMSAPVGRRRWRLPLRFAVLLYLALLILIPVGSVFFRAFQHGLGAAWDAISAPDSVHALWLTLLVALIAVPLNTIFGVSVSLILARHRFPGAWLLDALVDIPLAISPVVIGLALILVYGKTGWFGNWLAARGITVIFSIPGIVMAAAAVSLPYVVREVLPVLQEIGTEQEQAARTLGARPFTVFRRITLPNIRRGLAFGVTLTTARVMGEFGAVAIVSGAIAGKTETMPLFISDSIDNLDPQSAYIGAVALCMAALLVLTVLTVSDRKRDEWHGKAQA